MVWLVADSWISKSRLSDCAFLWTWEDVRASEGACMNICSFEELEGSEGDTRATMIVPVSTAQYANASSEASSLSSVVATPNMIEEASARGGMAVRLSDLTSKGNACPCSAPLRE